MSTKERTLTICYFKKVVTFSAIKYEKEIRAIKLERRKKTLFTDKMIAYIKNVSKFTDKPLKEMSLLKWLDKTKT